MIILYITTLAVMLNGQVEPQRTTLNYEIMEDCTRMKQVMTKSLETQMNKTLVGYSLECKVEPK
jgi:hypothetical protein